MVEGVALPLLIRDVHSDRTTSEEHPHISILWRKTEDTCHNTLKMVLEAQLNYSGQMYIASNDTSRKELI